MLEDEDFDSVGNFLQRLKSNFENEKEYAFFSRTKSLLLKLEYQTQQDYFDKYKRTDQIITVKQ